MCASNINKNTIFNNFPDYNPIDYRNSGVSKNNNTGNLQLKDDYIASVKIDDINKKSKRKNIITATVGSSIAAAGILALFLSKGLSSASYKKINELIETLNDKIYSGKDGASVLEKLNIRFAKGMKKVLSWLKASANFTAIKDSAFDMGARKTKTGTKIVDKITDVFKGFARQSVDEAYNKVDINTNYMHAYLQRAIAASKKSSTDLTAEIDIKGVKKTLGEWLDLLSASGDTMLSDFESGFSKSARLIRHEARVESLEGLDKKVQNAIWKDNGGIFNLKQNSSRFKSYVTEDLSQDGKVKIRNNIIGKKKIFSNNVEDNYTIVRTNIREIKDKLAIDDSSSIEQMRKIAKKMTDYTKLSGPDESKLREGLVQEIGSMLESFANGIQTSSKYTDEVKDSIVSQVEFITSDVLKNSNKGSLQEVMTILRGLTNAGVIDEQVSKKFFSRADEIANQINKASTLEANDLYDKYAEFKVGSAPTDITSLFLPLGVAAYSVAAAEDKNKKVSIALTTGIPLMGTVASMIIGTTKMIAGIKNLALGAGIGFALNITGNIINKLYLQYQEKQSFTKMAVDAYHNNEFFKNIAGK